MVIKHNGVTIADDAGRNPAGSFTVNHSRATDVSQIVRAASARIRNRGNRQTTIQFTLSREYASLRLAQVAALGIMEILPAAGPLEIICGGGGDTESVFFANAVFQGAQPQIVGVSPLVSLTYLCGASSLVPENPGGGETETGVTLSVPIDNGQQVVAVDYTSAGFLAPPRIVGLTVRKPGVNAYDIDAGSPYGVTAAGFTVNLSAPTQQAGYTLDAEVREAS